MTKKIFWPNIWFRQSSQIFLYNWQLICSLGAKTIYPTNISQNDTFQACIHGYILWLYPMAIWFSCMLWLNTMAICYFYMNGYLLFLYAITICYGHMLRLYAMAIFYAICNDYMLSLYDKAICYGYMLWLYAIAIWYGYMLWL